MPDVFVSENETVEKEKQIRPLNPHLQHNHPGFFTSFKREPDGVNFRDQDTSEKILLFLRPNFITNLSWIVMAIILLLIPFGISYLSSFINFFPSFLPERFLYFFIIFYYALIFNYIFIKFITWHFNISLVTTVRIVDIDFSDLVYHNVAMTKLEQVEDVNYTQVSFFATLFNYGDVFVQTAGEIVHFDFLAVNDPARVVTIINELIGRRRHGK